MLFYLLSIIQLIFASFVIYITIRVIFYKVTFKHTEQQHLVSIVIPFRNEAQNLSPLLESLSEQDYKGKYEIILVNDQSTDNYMPYIEKFRETHSSIPINLVTSRYNSELQLTSKQQAIDIGVQHASYDWIAFTDADMYLEKNWLSSLIHSTGDCFPIVYGHTIVKKRRNSFFEDFQAFQLEFLFAMAYAFHSAALRGSCMGNNLLISKNVYERIGGQSAIGYSIVEDRDLLNAAVKTGHSATAAIPFMPTAQTLPCETVSQFFHQALRWIKGGFKNSFNLIPVILLLGTQNIILLLSISRILPIFLLWISILNFILLSIFLYIVFKKIGSKENILLFPVYYIIMILETLLMIIPTLTMAPVWKRKKI